MIPDRPEGKVLNHVRGATRRNMVRIFPNLVNTIFLDESCSNTLGVTRIGLPPIKTKSPFQCANLTRRFGFPVKAETISLQSQIVFFAQEKRVNFAKFPESAQGIVRSCLINSSNSFIA